MAKVAKANEPREWLGWAATREQFAHVLRETERLLSEYETDDEKLRVSIEVAGYERSFESVDEFLENVASDEWTGLKIVSARISLGWTGLAARVRLFAVETASLHVTGGTRLQRNAVEPDIATAVERLARENWSFRTLWVRLLFPLLALPLAALFVIAFLVKPGTVAVLAVSAFVTAFNTTINLRLFPRWARVLSRSEFLPDDGKSVRTIERERIVLQAKLAGGVLAALAAVATIVGTVVLLRQ